MLCDSLEEWDGVGGRRDPQEGGETYIIIYTYGWRNQHSNVKQLSSN